MYVMFLNQYDCFSVKFAFLWENVFSYNCEKLKYRFNTFEGFQPII